MIERNCNRHYWDLFLNSYSETTFLEGHHFRWFFRENSSLWKENYAEAFGNGLFGIYPSIMLAPHALSVHQNMELIIHIAPKRYFFERCLSNKFEIMTYQANSGYV